MDGIQDPPHVLIHLQTLEQSSFTGREEQGLVFGSWRQGTARPPPLSCHYGHKGDTEYNIAVRSKTHGLRRVGKAAKRHLCSARWVLLTCTRDTARSLAHNSVGGMTPGQSTAEVRDREREDQDGQKRPCCGSGPLGRLPYPGRTLLLLSPQNHSTATLCLPQPSRITSLSSKKPFWTQHPSRVSLPLPLTEDRTSVDSGSPLSPS